MLMTKCKNEYFIHEFVEYYMNEGIDYILIYDDNSEHGTYDKIDVNFLPNVEIIKNDTSCKNRNILNSQLGKLYEKTKNFDWVICVDVDEYITSRDGNTIRTHLETTFSEFDYIKIPWVMMARNGRVKNPDSLLREIVHRWNHDIPHFPKITTAHPKFQPMYNFILTKAIFKPQKFRGLEPHGPISPIDSENIKAVDSVRIKKFNVNNRGHKFFASLREKDISSAILLCYHYRFCSEEHIYNKRENTIYNFQDIELCLGYDYPELIDTTIKAKVEKL